MSKSLARRHPAERYHQRRKASEGIPAQYLSTHRCPVDGKASFRSSKEARKALRAIREMNRATVNDGNFPTDFYVGPECGEIHLTSKPRRAA